MKPNELTRLLLWYMIFLAVACQSAPARMPARSLSTRRALVDSTSQITSTAPLATATADLAGASTAGSTPAILVTQTSTDEPTETSTLPWTPTSSATPTPTSTPTATATPQPVGDVTTFDGERAFAHLEAQMEMGPRWPGSPGHLAVRDYVIDTLTDLGWAVEAQRFDYQGFDAMNIIARANQGQGEVIILGAHYDTRRLADQTPGAAEAGLPVPGAVDGASGVAVLLELAAVLERDEVPRELWLAFFDVEDNGSGGIPGWDYIAGSSYMAGQLDIIPAAMVLVDMVGDADQQLYYEGNSDPVLSQTIWEIAADLGYNSVFTPTVRHTMIDDHLPFARLGIPAVDIIDFDYPYWHTVEDTIDKASPESLMRVGRTLEVWLEDHLGG